MSETVTGLDLEGLQHSFGPVPALTQVSFSVAPGQLVGLVGRNGAGKTTTMRSVMGIIRPDHGQVTWAGHPIGPEDRLGFGYMPEERGLYPHMRLGEQVRYFARLHGLGAQAAADRTSSLLEQLGISERESQKVAALSHGNQQRAQLAVALVHDPQLLVLDEPFSGLDPEAVDTLGTVLLDRADSGTAIVFSSHQLELVERLCRQVVIIDRGEVVVAGTLAELRARSPQLLRVRVDSPPGWASQLPGVAVEAEAPDGTLLKLDPGVDVQGVLRRALEAGSVDHFAFESASLPELFRQLVGTR